jgi:Homeodomain-like domain
MEFGERYQKEGWDGLYDRSSRPKCSPRLTSIEVVARIATLRRERRTGQQIALEVGVSKATVSRVLQRLGLHRLASLEPAEPVRRYERERPGELIHLDIKKLGRFKTIGHRITGNRKGQSNHRGVGWEFVHVSIDDASRIADQSTVRLGGADRRRLVHKFKMNHGSNNLYLSKLECITH